MLPIAPEILILPPLAIAAGIDLYLTLLLIVAAPTLGLWPELPGALGDLDSPSVLITVGVFYLLMKRGLDALLAHPAADAGRVAVTGLSGGGWQTALLAALRDVATRRLRSDDSAISILFYSMVAGLMVGAVSLPTFGVHLPSPTQWGLFAIAGKGFSRCPCRRSGVCCR